MPPDAQSVIIFAHAGGNGRNNPRIRYLAEVLRSYGCGTFLFDLLTAEEESQPQKAVELRYDIFILTKRLIAATRELKAQKGLEDMRIGYFASDTGAAAALCAAAELDGEIGAIVTRGGRPDFAGLSLFRVQAPTLFIAGELDEQVLKTNRTVHTHLNSTKDLQVVPGAGHQFEEPGAFDTMARLAGKWFHRYLVEQNGAMAA